MKIISINRELNQPVATAINHVTIIPDSAIIRDGKPFFVPGFSSQWKYQATIAFRVKRLGKNISTRFAHRYIDAIALAVNTLPLDLINSIAPSATTTAFDGAFIIGDWVETETFNDSTLSVTIGDDTQSIALSQLAIEETVASLSQYFTLKIGDIICPAVLPICNDIKLNTIIEGTLNGDNNLKLKFK
ncbi:MAG: fumarylacetoacetate hydrolase family protein [Muribaculaceae bacterium]|nr:fumarylacetoacetate hydrolase family protein [Muribaculaceae bacterium]